MRLPWTKNRSRTDASVDTSDLRERLTPRQFRVTQKGGTEPPFRNEYHATEDPGVYRCVVCDEPLFDSDDKFDSGTGWPSFTRAIEDGRVDRHRDRKLLMLRIEARCANCDAHLGHVFPDGPQPTGERFCMNSASLTLDRRPD